MMVPTPGRRFVELVVTSRIVSGGDLVHRLGSADLVGSVGETATTAGKQRVREESVWIVRSGREPLESIDVHLDALWTRAYEPLASLPSHPDLRARCLLRIVQYLEQSEPQGYGIGLSSDWIRLLAAVDGEVDIDQYVE